MELKIDPTLNEFMQKLKQPKEQKKTTTSSPSSGRKHNHLTLARTTGVNPKLARLASRDKVGKKGKKR